jgi:hypothetical protein
VGAARGFRSILRRLCKFLGVTVSASELERFVQSRNKLVHFGKFYCQAATAEEREKAPPLATPLEEFRFLVNFLDRIFLKLLGYSGTYIDWRERPPARAELP